MWAFFNFLGIVIDTMVGFYALSMGINAVGKARPTLVVFGCLLIIAGVIIIALSIINRREGYFFWLWMSLAFIFIGIKGIVEAGSIFAFIVCFIGMSRMNGSLTHYLNKIFCPYSEETSNGEEE